MVQPCNTLPRQFIKHTCPEDLKRGYDWSYEAFYRWGSIAKAASAHNSAKHSLKHVLYSAGWKKFEPAWDFVIRIKQLTQIRPLLETVLAPVGQPASDVSQPGEFMRPEKLERAEFASAINLLDN